jgi:hypothetical protein
MPTDSPEKVMVSRSLPTYLLENTGLFFWLMGKYISNLVISKAINLLVHVNGHNKNFSKLLADLSLEAIDKQKDTVLDLTLLGFRVITIHTVVTREAIEDAYIAPFRDQFLLVSALLDGYGQHSFIHKPTGYAHDKLVLKTALLAGQDELINRMREQLETTFNQPTLWETTPVSEIVRKMVMVLFGEIFLGIDKVQLLEVYDSLTTLLDTFERMWQHPDEFNPIRMFILYQQLSAISDYLHIHRRAADVPDDFARQYDRPMNVTAIFLVASNLIHFVTASILYQCTKGIEPDASDKKLEDLSYELATYRFTDSRIYRYYPNHLFGPSPTLKIGNGLISPRSLVIIPQGDINHKRMASHSFRREDGRVRPPALFGVGRPCPGSNISYAAVKSAFFAVKKTGMRFVANPEQAESYHRFIQHRENWYQGIPEQEPPVTGRWVSDSPTTPR